MNMKIHLDHDQRIVLKTAIVVSIIFCFFGGLMVYFYKHKTVPIALPSVIVQQAKPMKMAEYVTQTGTVVAYNSVDLVARIEGYLEAVEFTDGTFVKKGKELFIIEPKPYMEQLKAAQASVVIQKANYNYTQAEYERQKRMFKQNATSQNNVEKWAAKTEESKAEIDKAIANAEIAAINYSYTHVNAPFDGRIGRHLVDPGNLVGNGKATDLATLQQLDPIYVYFNLNELDLIKVRAAATSQAFNPAQLNTIPAYVRMQNEASFLHEGRLDFVNTALNASTGTMEFRALLKNKDYALLPGLFVQVRVPISLPTLQLTVPDEAVQYDQIGAYLLVLDENNVVLQKRVVVGALEQGIRAIVKGLNAKDNVVISGLQNAIPGHRVVPVHRGKK